MHSDKRPTLSRWYFQSVPLHQQQQFKVKAVLTSKSEVTWLHESASRSVGNPKSFVMPVDKQMRGLFISFAVNVGAGSPRRVLGLSEANRAQGHSVSPPCHCSMPASPTCHFLLLDGLWPVSGWCVTPQEVRKEAKRGHEHARAPFSCLSVRNSTFPYPRQRPDSLVSVS